MGGDADGVVAAAVAAGGFEEVVRDLAVASVGCFGPRSAKHIVQEYVGVGRGGTGEWDCVAEASFEEVVGSGGDADGEVICGAADGKGERGLERPCRGAQRWRDSR